MGLKTYSRWVLCRFSGNGLASHRRKPPKAESQNSEICEDYSILLNLLFKQILIQYYSIVSLLRTLVDALGQRRGDGEDGLCYHRPSVRLLKGESGSQSDWFPALQSWRVLLIALEDN